MNDVLELLNQVVTGNFSCYDELAKYVPKSKLSVFISSTFTDSHAERNVLNEVILPLLQEKYREHGIQIMFSDMRFGVKDENTLNNDTWELCKEEIRRCSEESDGLFFLSLQSEKYGYEPLPKYLPVDFVNNFTIRRSDVEVIALVSEWYRLDDNNVPPRYELKSLGKGSEEVFYKEILPKLKKEFLKEFEFEAGLKTNQSITEWETRYAVSLDEDSHKVSTDNELSRIHWAQRRFLEEDTVFPADRFLSLFDTTQNSEKGIKLKNLISFMNNISSVSSFCINPISYLLKNESFDNYLVEWKDSLIGRFTLQLEKMIDLKRFWITDIVPGHKGDELFEILHHCRFSKEKSNNFFGREQLMSHCMTKIFSDTMTADPSGDQTNELAAITLALVGQSGTGKTSLMAKLAFSCYEQLFSRGAKTVPVIIRFCGPLRRVQMLLIC
jgi:hypothetical protein